LTEIAIRGRNHTRRSPSGSGSTEPLEFALLQEPEKLGLCQEAHFADFIEEQCAAGGQLDMPRFGLKRAGEGTSLVAKELRLEELFGHRAQLIATNGPSFRSEAS
jgi:hypothetical protein